MNRLHLLFIVGVGLAAEGLALEACTPGQREDARTVLDITKTLCIVAHQALPESDVAKVCGVAEPLFGPMRDILSGARAASAQAVAGARLAGSCIGAPDAGAERTKP